MFYILIEDNMHILLCEEGSTGAIPVEDDVENLYLYHYDAVNKKIYKREEISYEVIMRDIPYVRFNTEKLFSVQIHFIKEGHTRSISTDLSKYSVSDENTGKIIDTVFPEFGIKSNVDGLIYIMPGSNKIFFEPIEIHVTDTIENEYEPKMYMDGPILTVEPSDNYRRLSLLQSEVETLQSDVTILKEEIRILKGGNNK